MKSKFIHGVLLTSVASVLGLCVMRGIATAVPNVSVTSARACLTAPSDVISFTQAVSQGDDLILVISGQGYGNAAPTVSSVSDTVNGTWTALVNDQSLKADSTHYLSYAVYHLPNSLAAAHGVTVTVKEQAGQTAASAVLLDVSGPVSEDATQFQQTIQQSTPTLASPTITAQSGELALGLFGAYGYGQSFTIGSGWTLAKSASSCTVAYAESQNVNATGPLQAKLSANSTAYIGGIITFKSAQGTVTAPSAPSAVTGTTGNGTVSLTWTAPASNGGSAISGYRVTPYMNGVAQPAANTGSVTTSYLASNLTNGTSYTFSVAAINAIGTGQDSTQSNAYTPTAPTAPGAPTSLTGSAGDGIVHLSWTAPASNGGSAITNYQVTTITNGTAQSTAITNSTNTSYTATGLTNGTSYTFSVAAINAIGTSGTSAPTNPITPNATTTTALVAPMPLIDHNLPVYGGGNVIYDPSNGNNDTYGSGSASYLCGPPCSLMVDLSSVPVAQRQQVVVAWYNNETNFYAAAINNTYYNEPKDYTIDASNAPGNATPPTTWTTLSSVTGNFYNGRQHFLNLNGANWIRINVTAVNGSSGNMDASFDFDVHDASQGNNDTWLMLGDSITQDDMGQYEPTNFMQQIHTAYPTYAPSEINGGIGGWDASSPLQTDPRTSQVYIDEFLNAFPGHFVSLDYGTNDANEGGTPLTTYASNMTALINKVIAAGKVPVLRRSIPWGCTANIQANGPTVNADLRQLLATYPQAIPGPDEWSYFQANQNLINTDCIHPIIGSGNAAYRQIYVSALLQDSLY